MGIYLPNMEMPADGNETIIRIQPDGTVLDQYGHHLAITAVPVPAHWRLIDADALYESCALDANIDVMASAKRINEYMQLKIDEAPAVIPAESEGA